ncbi:hypothetical protein N7508_007766 [Penicillium antarcticum]|uniref:uncharacterized protein n=1 Tax=Penicillium antarcticum TaxID=416450 RepID=UPI0023A1D41F|nr:uncharacterized protein N7508_007766 [Penicillium antarcticum]KAJ5297517.1 hypothetical protein N7508_007766 [Penicillium antarcticum]
MATQAANAVGQEWLAYTPRPLKRRRVEISTPVMSQPLPLLAPLLVPGQAPSVLDLSQPKPVEGGLLCAYSHTAMASDSLLMLGPEYHSRVMDCAVPLYCSSPMQQLPLMQQLLPKQQLPFVQQLVDLRHISPMNHQPLVPPTGPYNFIRVDPVSPERFPLERITRTQAQIQNQKEESAVVRLMQSLRKWQGAYLKGHICIRGPEQLYMLGAINLPSKEGWCALKEMERVVFATTDMFYGALRICRKDTFGSRTWIFTESRYNLMRQQEVIDSFIDIAIDCLGCIELSGLEASYSSNSLVETATGMTKLFIVTRCMPRLAWEQSKEQELHPIFVAWTLYKRTADGVSRVRDDPVIKRIIGDDCQIRKMCDVIKSVLDYTYPTDEYMKICDIKDVFDKKIPKLPSPSFDMAFSRETSDLGKPHRPPESCYAMASFLFDDFPSSASPVFLNAAQALVTMSASFATPFPMAQDGLLGASFADLYLNGPLYMLQDTDQIFGAGILSRSGSLETLKSTDSTETLPDLPDTRFEDRGADPSMEWEVDDIFKTIESGGGSSSCSCCNFTCYHEEGTEGCCHHFTECSPGKCCCS